MDADDLCWMDACELEQRYQRRDVSPVEVVDALISRIERLNPGLNAFITITADSARTEARRAERDFHRGERLSRLHGIPVAIKDVISTRGIRTTMGSAIYRDFIPDDDAFVVRRLKEAGAIIIGKTHTHEFAFAPVMSDTWFAVAHRGFYRSDAKSTARFADTCDGRPRRRRRRFSSVLQADRENVRWRSRA